MTHITCRLTAKNRDQLRNPTLGSRVWATFFIVLYPLNGDRVVSVDSVTSLHPWSGCGTVLYCRQASVRCRCLSDRVAAVSFAGTTTPIRADVECLHTAVAVATAIASTAPTSAGAPAVNTRMMTSPSPWQPPRPLPAARLVREFVTTVL